MESIFSLNWFFDNAMDGNYMRFCYILITTQFRIEVFFIPLLYLLLIYKIITKLYIKLIIYDVTKHSISKYKNTNILYLGAYTISPNR